MKLANSARSLGRILRDARRERGFTQMELATQTGMAQPTISKIERGAEQTSLDSILRLLAALKLEFVVRERSNAHPQAPWQTPVSED